MFLCWSLAHPAQALSSTGYKPITGYSAEGAYEHETVWKITAVNDLRHIKGQKQRVTMAKGTAANFRGCGTSGPVLAFENVCEFFSYLFPRFQADKT